MNSELVRNLVLSRNEQRPQTHCRCLLSKANVSAHTFGFGGYVPKVKMQHQDLVSNLDSVFKDCCEDHVKHTWQYLFLWLIVSIEKCQRELITLDSGWRVRTFLILPGCGKSCEFLHQILIQILFHLAHLEIIFEKGINQFQQLSLSQKFMSQEAAFFGNMQISTVTEKKENSRGS